MFHFSLKHHYLKVSCYVFVIVILSGLLLNLDSGAVPQEVQAAAPSSTATPKASSTPTPKQTVSPRPASSPRPGASPVAGVATPAPAKTPLPGTGSPPVPAGNQIGGANAPFLSMGDGSWFWQNPLPQPFTIGSISCPQPANCFAAAGSRVLLTTDAGATWSRQFYFGSFYLTDISCPALNNCFGVGSSGGAGVYTSSIFHFDGTDWQVQYTYTADVSDILVRIACWAVNSCMVTGNSRALVYDGISWNVQTPVVLVVPLNDQIQIACPAIKLCLITASAKIWRYSNGNWSSLDITTIDDQLMPLGSLACFSATHCLITSARIVSRTPFFTTKPVFLETFDGGNSWTERDPPASLPFDGQTRYSCPNATTCYAITVSNTGSRSEDSQVYVTTNAGSSWNLIHETIGTIQPPLLAISCWNPTTCLLGGGGGLTFTYDNGNWNQLSSGNIADDLLDISCPAPNRCFAVGSAGKIMIYDGQNWAYTTAISGLVSIDCPSINVCYAVTLNQPYNAVYTNDGGQTWQVQWNVSNNDLMSISCPAVDTCFAVGFRGSIVSLKNGVWSAETSNTTAYLLSISCPAINLCFAVGYNDPATDWVILTYNGTSWNTQFPGFNTIPYPTEVSCPATNRCFAVAGTSLLTYDGTAWTVQLSVIPVWVAKLDCPVVDTCFMVGSNATVTYQNGVWTTEPIEGNDYAWSISCPTVTICFVVGQYGWIAMKGYPVTSLSDDGSGTQLGTLSFGLKNTAINQPIIFNLKGGNTILVSGQLPPVPAGKSILGSCSTNGPTVTLEGGGTTTGGLVLSGNNLVAGLNVTGFKGRQLVLQGHGNHLQCMTANR